MSTAEEALAARESVALRRAHQILALPQSEAAELSRTGKGRGWLVRRMLAAADVLGLITAFALVGLWSSAGRADNLAGHVETLVFALTIPAWILAAKLYRLYDYDEERTDHSTADEFVGVFHLVTVGSWVLFAFFHYTALADPDVQRVFGFWLLAIVLIPTLRSLARAGCRRTATYRQNTVIVGAGEIGQLVAHKLRKHPEYGINLLGFFDDQPKAPREDIADMTLLGSPESLPEVVGPLGVKRVIIAFSNDEHEKTLDLIRRLKNEDVQIDIVPRFFEVVGSKVDVHMVEGLPLVGMGPARLPRSSLLLKRSLDVIGALAGLIVLSPVLLVVALAIRLDSRGPVFFRQVRMGTNERTFRIFKFRTMALDADERKGTVAHLNIHARNGGDPRMFKITDDPRITRVGRFLRRYSLDELPQLINVVRGEMSLVGPRPLILDEDQYVRAWARLRLSIKPGITGPWQVLGRNHIPFGEMVRLDYLYVMNWSPWLDVKLLFQTIPVVLARRGAY